MAVQSKVWEQVGEKFEVLGTHLRGHFDEVGVEASAERTALEKSIRGMLSALEEGFTTARKAMRDPELRHDVSEVAVSVRQAMLASFETAGEQVRERLSGPVGQARRAVSGVAIAPRGAAPKAAAPKAAAPKAAAPKAAAPRATRRVATKATTRKTATRRSPGH